MITETMTLYEAEKLFNLPDTYNQADVKEAYRKLILEKHPDVRKDVDAVTANKEASEINAAKKLLLNRFKANPQASFTRLKSEKHSYSTSPFTSQTRTYQTSTTTSTTAQNSSPNWYEQWWAAAPPETDTAPVEEVTWEDLANEYWAEYANETADTRIAQKRSYSMSDLKRDTVSSVVGGASKGVARFVDGLFGDGDATPVDVNQDIIAYETKKHKIDWATGRLAVLGYFVVISFLVFLGILAFSDADTPMDYGYAMMVATVVYGLAVINVFIPFITVVLRKIPYRRLDKEYARLRAKQDNLN